MFFYYALEGEKLLDNYRITISSSAVTAKSFGIASISAKTGNGKISTITITVKKTIEAIKINEEDIRIKCGREQGAEHHSNLGRCVDRDYCQDNERCKCCGD